MSDKPINSLPPTIKSTQQKSTSDVSTQGLKTMTPVKPTISSNLVEPNRLVSSTVEKGKIVEPSSAPISLVSNKQSKGVLVNESLLTPNKVINQDQKDTSSVKLPNTVNTTKAPQLNKCRTTLSNMNGDTIGNGQEVITTCNGCIVVRTDKNVYVNVTENTIEQNYIKNNGGLGTTLCVGTVNTGNTYTNVVSNVQKLAFDDSDFSVSDLGSGIAKVTTTGGGGVSSLNTLTGAITLSAGTNVTIGSSGNTLTICSSGGGVVNAATPTTLGTVFGCTALNAGTALGYGSASGGLNFNSTIIGGYAGPSGVQSSCNTLFGYGAMYCHCGSGNVGIGINVLYGKTGSNGFNNVAIGNEVMLCNNFGKCNVAIGYNAMILNNNGSENVAIGAKALCKNTDSCYNTAIGTYSQNNNYGSTGNFNTSVGAYSLSQNVTGIGNTAVGYGALNYGCGSYNIGIGYQAGCNITTGSNNTIIGSLAGSAGLVCTVLIGAGTCERIKVDNNGLCINGSLIGGASPATPTALGTVYANTTTTTCNTYLGFCAGNTTGTGYGNIAMGACSLTVNSTGVNNIAIGIFSLNNTQGDNNIGIGAGALLCNSTGYQNIAIGGYSLQRNIFGTYNISIGDFALNRNTTGCDNLAIGSAALNCNTFGSQNIALGLSASRNNISGNNNVAVGWNALRCNLTSDNVAIGYCSGFSISTGTRNITFGSCSGCSVSTGSNNTIIGSLAGTAGLVCTVLIGAGTCERIKVDNNGLCINGSLFTGGGVSSLNTLTGAVTLSGGTNVTIGSSGNTLTICSSGGGGGVTSVATSGSGLGFSLSGGPITTTGTVSLTVPTVTDLSTCLQGDGLCNTSVGFRILPQNSQSADYALVAADSGKHLLHPSSDANARTFTIPANSSVAYPIGTSITFVNETSQVLTIAITSDTMYLAGSGLTGSRTLSQYGVATAIKTGSTTWYISGTGLT